MGKPFELPEDRLATTDEKGRRVYLYPADVRGFFRRLRSGVQFVLIVIFLTLPWLRIDGKQALLFDIPNRKFHLFGLFFWAHDIPLLVLVLAAIAFSVALITALAGRVWCGWGCPETVFVDGVFRRIERWIEGNALNRKKLDEGPWNFQKFFKKILKWILFLLVSLVLTHSFLAYFIDTRKLAQMMTQSPTQNPGPFVFMTFLTAVIVFAFGWFREQFCIIVCPYGRMQSVLMDEHSLSVMYDTQRGEPRKGSSSDGKEGDCVNCYRCVQVCPTGIDIRRGVQLECVGCTACIDACDEVMTRTHKPKGLIRYDTERGLKGLKTRFFRARTLIYGAVLILVLSLLFIVVAGRKPLDVTLLRTRDFPYQTQNDGSILNHFQMELSNQMLSPIHFELILPPNFQEKGYKMTTQFPKITVEPGKFHRVHFFIQFPKKELELGQAEMTIEFRALSSELQKPYTGKKELRLVGPF